MFFLGQIYGSDHVNMRLNTRHTSFERAVAGANGLKMAGLARTPRRRAFLRKCLAVLRRSLSVDAAKGGSKKMIKP